LKIDFQYQGLPWNILFSPGVINSLPEELGKLGFKRALVLSTPQQVDQANELALMLDMLCVGVFSDAVMHVPLETVTTAMKVAQELKADCSVSIGGGSTTGLGKALAIKSDLPNIAIPTTYAGSEMTNIWGITEAGRKTTGRDVRVVPNLTIYDPELTLGLPSHIAGPSGLNAMAQAVVNVTTKNMNPIVSVLALDAVRALSKNLPIIIEQPDNLEARSSVLYGACLAGASLGTGSTSLHHRLCHTFGGSFNTPHAETHTVLLPHSVAYNAAATEQGTRQLANTMQVEDPAIGIFELAKIVGAPTALKDIGVKESDLDEAVTIATEKALENPEPVTKERLRLLLENAYHGNTPEAV
jgi:maleylacetate reductase